MRQSKETKRKRVWPRVLISLVVIIIVASLIALYYLFNFAFSRDGFSTQLGQGVNTEWYDTNPSQTWTQKTKSGLTLKAHYFAAAQPTNKTILVVHGYGGSARRMSTYLRMFHNEGYNVLAPDNQAFGESQGRYVGYGWQDRTALAGWMHQINQYNPHGEIGMYGISMGASAVLFTLPKAPANVKFAIADCGYASIQGELEYELQHLFHLPTFPIIPMERMYSRILAGYDFADANTSQTLKHNQIPLFIIHGDQDHLVPTRFAYENYRNNGGKQKQLWIVKGAGHAQSKQVDPELYQEKTAEFAKRWFDQ
ncbi:alpha/beta hydrolase [Fructilactobacillus florum]|uniref:alpha/beta hydrolase n=1 Tax=Fructilactobacillus florum TaxID=640331 RepID=UPI00058DF516|nr:alpha/beta hydrolase [Fructilactobacillus florum]